MAIKKKKNTSIKETYRQGLLLGMGIASLSKKAVDAYMRKLVKENKLSTREGEALARNLVRTTRKVSNKVARVVKANVKEKAGSALSLSRQGLQTLDKTLSVIEKQLQATPKVKKKKRRS